MNAHRWYGRYRDEQGVALVVVMAFLLVMTVFATMVFATMRSTQLGSRQVRNVTTARAVADAGAEKLIFDLGLTGTTTPWDTYTCTLPNATDPLDPSVSSCVHSDTIGEGTYHATVTPGSDSTKRQLNVVGEYPTGSGDYLKIEVELQRTVPKAFSYSMFADTALNIHHHGTMLAPQIATTQVHSNGDADLPVSAEFHVELFSVVGTLELKGDGDGSTNDHPNISDNAVGGDIGEGGYSWRYDIGPWNRCYPIYNPITGQDVSTPDGSVAGNGCGGKFFAGNATIVGDVWAHSVSMGSRSIIARGNDRTSVSGDTIPAVGGNVIIADDGEVDIDGTTVEGEIGDVFTDCSGKCLNGSGDPYGINQHNNDPTSGVYPGKIGGYVRIEDSGPERIEFPSIDYENTYKPRAVDQESGGTCSGTTAPAGLDCGGQHVFEGDDDFLEYITDPANGHYWYIKNDGTHAVWPGGNGFQPNYILLRGDYYVYGGINFDAEDVNQMVADEVGPFEEDYPAIPIVIAGSLISPDGGMDMGGRLYLVGRGNRTDFLESVDENDNGQPDDGEDVEPNICRFLNRDVESDGQCGDDVGPAPGFSDVEPGILAAGGGMNASDIDSDNSWEDDNDYEPAKRNAVWVRGIAYAGEWDEDDQRSTAQDYHWHSADPKNSVRLFGAQVGGKLHNCNNFYFTYDDIVQNAFGFSGESESMEVLSWDEVPVGG